MILTIVKSLKQIKINEFWVNSATFFCVFNVVTMEQLIKHGLIYQEKQHQKIFIKKKSFTSL